MILIPTNVEIKKINSQIDYQLVNNFKLRTLDRLNTHI